MSSNDYVTDLTAPNNPKRITSGSMCLGLSAFMKFVSRYRKKVEDCGEVSIRRGHLQVNVRSTQ